MAWEKINTIIERDIGLVILIMGAGLLYSDETGMRGFPVPWFFPSQSAHMHSSFWAFWTSLIASIAIVVICEIINTVFRIGSEPTAFRNTSSQASVYANTYDDTSDFQDIPDTGAFEAKDTSNYSKALRKSQKMFRKVEQALPKSIPEKPERRTSRTAANSKLALKLVAIIFASTIIFMGAIFAVIFSNNGFEDDIATDDFDTEYSDEDSGSLYGTPFFEDTEYLQGECDRIFELLKNGDEKGLSEIGEGDAAALLGLIDWSSAEFERDYRYAVKSEPDEGFIRFYVTSADGDCMLGIKFEGDELGTDENSAVVTGVSACSYDPWNEYDSEKEDAWNKLMESVEAGSIAVGDDRFMGYSILLW